MIFANLTSRAGFAHRVRPGARMGARRSLLGAAGRCAVLLGSAIVGGCVSVNAPDEPIVIELNINITQEVIYRLAEDVRDNIEENPEIF